MSFVILGTCCTDASCVAVCPVNCIHPTPDEPGFGTAELLHVDPATCIDCGACADACPVDAVVPVETLVGADREYADVNAAYYAGREAPLPAAALRFPVPVQDGATGLRVAVVGTGPAACYTARELLQATGAQVTMLDRLPVPGGLLRCGVAPDHPSTKRIGDGFAALFRHPRVTTYLGVEVGRDLTHDELLEHHSAVVYAVGAPDDRRLGLPGEDLAGSVPASDVVAWYNGAPDRPALDADLGALERVVVIGTGNVALDVARVLLRDPEALAHTDIADPALAALRRSAVREVVLLGRRGPGDAAWSRTELRALLADPDLEVVVADAAGAREAVEGASDPAGTAALLRRAALRAWDGAAPPAPGRRRLVLRFGAVPTELHGSARVQGVHLADGQVVTAGLVVRAIGYRGRAVPGVPYDPVTGTVPHTGGRVVDPGSGQPAPGTYVVGWAKRGPSGGIGTNRVDASQTVAALLEDAASGALQPPRASARSFARLVARRVPRALDAAGAAAVDRAERRRGQEQGRPRVKLLTVEELLAAGRR